jgi:RecB family endonuclease NucS
LYVIELKKGQSDDEIVGQVSRYMGWVKKNIAVSGQNVYGIICVSNATEKLKYAVEAIQNISLYSYNLIIASI